MNELNGALLAVVTDLQQAGAHDKARAVLDVVGRILGATSRVANVATAAINLTKPLLELMQ